MKESSAFKNAKLCFEGPSDLRSTGDNIKLQTCNGEENQVYIFFLREIKALEDDNSSLWKAQYVRGLYFLHFFSYQ